MSKTQLIKPLILSISLALVACGASEDSGDDTNVGTGGGDSGGGDTGDGSGGDEFINSAGELSMSFDLTGAVALVANEDLVSASAAPSAGGTVLRVVGGKAKNVGYPLRALIDPRNGGEDSQASDVAGSNLLALDEQGNLTPALTTNYPIKVMYTVVSPDGDKVYLALDPGWWDYESNFDEDGNYIDFSRAIAESNCALIEVDVATGTESCVTEGIFVQAMNDDYMKAISGNQKPIQFDAEGNLYFAGTTFSIEEETWEHCEFNEQTQAEVCETYGYSWIETTDWQPRIYQRDVGAASATAVTQDNEYIEFFSVLKSGELVYQSRNDQDYTALLKMLQGESVIDLTDGTGWGVDFFTVDDRNAVIFGQADWSGNGANGLRFARPRTTFGVEKASLDTSLFGGDNGNKGWGNPKPRRLLVSDNGRIYGVFEGGRDQFDANGNSSGWESTLTVYQILPFDGVPKLELSLGNEGWWHWMENTPFQISGDLLYYKESVDVPYLGTADVIVMVDLETKEKTQLLTPDNTTGEGRYEIYNWRLAGNELHFSGLKKDNNSVVTGVIDTDLFDSEADSSVYFTVSEVASAAGAASAIQDIEIIRQVSEETDPGVEPTMTFFQSMENLFSMSIDFSTTMDWDSVEASTTLVEDSTTDVEMMKIWVNKTLHIIPDLDGLGDSSSTTPMAAGTEYSLTVATGVLDSFGNQTSADTTSSITTRPSTGWYVNDADVLLYAGKGDSSWTWKTYDLTQAALPANFELEFDAKNFNWDGVELMLFDIDGAEYQRSIFHMGMNGWSWISYADTSDEWQWEGGETHTIFNGGWKTYRIRVFGNNLTVESKRMNADDSKYRTEDLFSVTDLKERLGTNYRLMFRVLQPIGLDNIAIDSLNSDGTLDTADVFTEDFTGYTVTGSTFETDLTETYNDLH